MLRSDLYDCGDTYIVVKMTIIVEEDNDAKKTRNKKLIFKNNAPCHANQKSITQSLIMQKILILLCQCIICYNIVTIIA